MHEEIALPGDTSHILYIWCVTRLFI